MNKKRKEAILTLLGYIGIVGPMAIFSSVEISDFLAILISIIAGIIITIMIILMSIWF